jgi:16S rRNA (cytosine967-C5)-methyltransferase
VQQHGRRQPVLLDTVWPALKPGGRLVYAVCSLTRTETTEVVDTFLKAHLDAKLDTFAHPMNGNPTDGTLTLLPSETRGDGMFIARFCKQNA